MRYVETIEVPINLPEDYPGNPRVHDDEYLDDTTSPGQHRSIAVRRLPDGGLQILGGHGTRRALQRRGDATIRAEVFEADDDEARWVVLSDNPRPGVGGFDHPALLALLDTERESTGDLKGTGWTGDAYDDLVKLLEAPDLDRLAGEVGEPKESDLWPVFRIVLPQSTLNRYRDLVASIGDAEDHELFAAVVELAERGSELR